LNKKYDIIIIGAGPAGLMAGIAAAKSGAKTAIIEKMSQPGKKLLITANGRCNITNSGSVNDFIKHYHPDGRFLRQALNAFSSDDLTEFLAKLKIPTKTEPDGCVFPVSEKARQVRDTLVNAFKGLAGSIITEAPVQKILTQNNNITGVIIRHARENITIQSSKVIITTGGTSWPQTGSTGDGYKLAKALGHNITTIRAALIPLITKTNTPKKLQGLSCQNVTIKLISNNKIIDQKNGQILFTHFGISGPALLLLSAQAVNELQKNSNVSIAIDLVPELTENQLNAKMTQLLHDKGKQIMKNFAALFLQRKMIPVFLDLANIPHDTCANQLSAEKRKNLCSLIKNFQLDIAAPAPIEDAIVTAGGIDTKQIDPRSMQSRLIKGLYFAGEVIDIDGDTGGYNLQAAFSTGQLAGLSAASSL
jgi:hypothetical protein